MAQQSEQQNVGQVPSSNQEDPTLINNPRYMGQSGGTEPQGSDGRGPLQESRYGASAVSTGSGDNNQQTTSHTDTIRDPAAYGFQGQQQQQQTQPGSGFRPPGMSAEGNNNPQQTQQSGYQNEGMQYNQQGSQGVQNLAHPNAPPSEAGYGQTQGGYRDTGTQMNQPGVPGQGQYVGSQNNQQGSQGAQNMAHPNAPTSEAGYGPTQVGYGDTGTQNMGYNNQQNNRDTNFALPPQPVPVNEQVGFGSPAQSQNPWPTPTAPVGAKRLDDLEHDQQPRMGHDRAGVNNGGRVDPSRVGEGDEHRGYGAPKPYVSNDQGSIDRPAGESPQYGNDGAPIQAGGTGGQGQQDISGDRGQYPNPATQSSSDTTSVGPNPDTGLGDNVMHPSEATGFGGGLVNTPRHYDGTANDGTANATTGNPHHDTNGMNNTTVDDSTGAPPKKTMMTKIKEKLQH